MADHKPPRWFVEALDADAESETPHAAAESERTPAQQFADWFNSLPASSGQLTRDMFESDEALDAARAYGAKSRAARTRARERALGIRTDSLKWD